MMMMMMEKRNLSSRTCTTLLGKIFGSAGRRLSGLDAVASEAGSKPDDKNYTTCFRGNSASSMACARSPRGSTHLRNQCGERASSNDKALAANRKHQPSGVRTRTRLANRSDATLESSLLQRRLFVHCSCGCAPQSFARSGDAMQNPPRCRPRIEAQKRKGMNSRAEFSGTERKPWQSQQFVYI